MTISLRPIIPRVHLLGMMLAEPFEDLARRHMRPKIGEGFVDTLSQPVANRRFLAIEGAQCSAHYLVRGGIGAGLHPRLDMLLEVAERDGDRSAGGRHGNRSLLSEGRSMTLPY
jgi:hypothetical protein